MIKVLAVDDEEPIRQWLAYCIAKFDGFCCVTAASAQEGLELFRLEQPDIVLSDIEMPGINGLEMLRLLQLESELCSIVLTSHEDFAYARAALKLNTTEYMLKTEMNEESLYAVLQKAGSNLQKQREDAPPALMQRERFLQAVALGKCAEPVSAELLARYHVPLCDGPLLAIDCWNASSDAELETAIKALPALRDAVYFTLGADHLILLLNLAEDPHRGKDEVEQVWQALLAPYGGASCGISDLHSGIGQLPCAIEQARRRGTLQFYLTQRKVFCCDPVPPDMPPDEELFRLEYMRCLLDQDFPAAYKRLSAFARQVWESYPSDITAVKKEFLTWVVSFLYFAANTAEDADAQEKKAREAFLKSGSFSHLLDAIDQTLRPYQHRAASWGITTPIRQAIEYVEQRYAEKITLGDVAGYVAFSPEHFSRLFVKETGVNFVTYVNNLRMKNAVKLLETTNDKVYEIAERVGFASLSYFSTSFKKKFGQNPYEYQISFQKQKGQAQ